MNIQQLSTNIDQKLAQLERNIHSLQQQLRQPDAQREIINKDLAALEQLKIKLEKSRDIAWRAHKLQRENDEQLLKRKRWLGIGLCLISAVGLLAIAAVLILR